MAGKCNNPRFQEMLHAYELNMLSGDALEAFELHLIECEFCADEVARLEKVSELLDRDPLVGQSIDRIVSEERAESAASEEAIPGYDRRRYRLIGVTAIAAAILVFLILKPWDIVITPDQQAAAENRLTIMYFDNVQDPADTAKLGEIATNLLINDLSESGYLQVLSSQRLYDIMRLLEFDGLKRIDKNVASKLAEKARAKWILNGTILKTEPYMVIAAQLFDATSGAVIASQKITGRPGEDIFALTDSLAAAVEKDLSLPSQISRKARIAVSKAGSRSRQAWRYYLDGVDNYNRVYMHEAQKDFETALAFDSSLAMAYYYLAIIHDSHLLINAKELSANVGPKEKYYIDILEAQFSDDNKTAARLLREFLNKYPEEKQGYFMLSNIERTHGNMLKSVELLNNAIALDSLYKVAYANLIYDYISLDSLSSAIRIADRYIAMAPGEANPFDSKGDIYRAFGMNEEAVRSFQTALKIKPDFYLSLKKLIILKLCLGDSTTADSCNKIFCSLDESYRYWLLPYLKGFKGRIYEALDLLDSAIIALNDAVPDYHQNKALLYDELNEPQKALDEIQSSIKIYNDAVPNDRLTNRNLLIYLLARAGHTDSAYALARQLGKWCAEREYSDKYYWGFLGIIEFVKGEYARASGYFDRAVRPDMDFKSLYFAGVAYVADRQYTAATTALERITGECPLMNSNIVWAIKAHYYLGLAYEGAGRKSDAAAQYQYVVDLWKDADPQIDCLKDARKRLLEIRQI